MVLYKRHLNYSRDISLNILKFPFNSETSKGLDESFYYYNEFLIAFFSCNSLLITSGYMKANKDNYFKLT